MGKIQDYRSCERGFYLLRGQLLHHETHTSGLGSYSYRALIETGAGIATARVGFCGGKYTSIISKGLL